MKIKKSTKALAAAASLAMMATVGLSACGGGSNDAETTADGKVKITMWHGFSEADGKTSSPSSTTSISPRTSTRSTPSCSRGAPSARPW